MALTHRVTSAQLGANPSNSHFHGPWDAETLTEERDGGACTIKYLLPLPCAFPIEKGGCVTMSFFDSMLIGTSSTDKSSALTSPIFAEQLLVRHL